MTEVITINRGDWTGKTTEVSIRRAAGKTTFTLSHLPGEWFDLYVDHEPEVDGVSFRLTQEHRTIAHGALFEDGTALFMAAGVEREATGENADVIAAAQLICNIL